MTWHCTIPGQPVAMARPRFAGGPTPRAYIPPRTRLWIAGAAQVIRAHWKQPPLEGPVAVELIFVHQRPKRLMGKKHTTQRQWRGVRPDLDNLAKCALDAMQAGGVFADDGQVAVIEARDMYAAKKEAPCVEISAWRLLRM